MIRRLTASDASAFLTVRRSALEDAPFAFASSPEDDRSRSREFVEQSLAASDQAVFGAFAAELVGIVGVHRDRHLKALHKCHLSGLYVAPASRSAGVGRALVTAALEFARSLPGVTHVFAGVTDRAPQAAALYRDLGFTAWGVEQAALRVGDALVAETHLVLTLDGDSA